MQGVKYLTATTGPTAPRSVNVGMERPVNRARERVNVLLAFYFFKMYSNQLITIINYEFNYQKISIQLDVFGLN